MREQLLEVPPVVDGVLQATCGGFCKGSFKGSSKGSKRGVEFRVFRVWGLGV